MAKKEPTYEEALLRLQQIVDGLENNELDIDSLSERLKEAQDLLKFCKSRLQKVEKDIKKVLDHEQE